jgi:hypothetical protein
MMPAPQEPLDVIIIPYSPCPCRKHPQPSELFIYRTVPYGVFSKAEVHCVEGNGVWDASFLFMPQE